MQEWRLENKVINSPTVERVRKLFWVSWIDISGLVASGNQGLIEQLHGSSLTLEVEYSYIFMHFTYEAMFFFFFFSSCSQDNLIRTRELANIFSASGSCYSICHLPNITVTITTTITITTACVNSFSSPPLP